MANVIIDIAAEFTGKKGFKQAETATDKMTKNVKKLAGAFGLAFSATAVLAYGKAAVKAAAEDEKAQKQLALALKNVGLGRDAASSEAYIQSLQSEFGIVDDLLRPAYQTLAIATRDSAESQRLLNLSLDISAATGKDLGAVTTALSRAYLGNNTALTRLGVGISKADLKTKSFVDITEELAKTFAGAATESANSLAGQMAKLEVASANVQEILGKGIIDSLIILSGNTSVDELAVDMETAATNAAAFLATVSEIVRYLNQPMMSVSGSIADFVEKTSPFVNLIIEGDPSGFMKKKPKPFTTPMTISGQVRIKQEKMIAKLVQQQAVSQAKILKDKKLQNAIDKANLALGKGSDVFDLDRIQIAAALTNQAESLGKATSAAQALQIANDTARLNVKQSILALEDAIAAKDEAAIVAATNKLNADLKVLGALTGQSIKLSDIKSILESLKPVDLINLANLDAAIAKMMELLKLQGTKTLTPTQGNTSVPSAVSTPSAISSPTAIAELMTGIGSNLKEFTILTDGIANSFQKIEDVGAFNALTNMYAGGAINPFNAGSFRMAEGGSTFSSGAVGSRDVNITVNAGVGDPEAIARAVEDVIRQSYQRGTSSTGLLAL
jgi:hypothetical protein